MDSESTIRTSPSQRTLFPPTLAAGIIDSLEDKGAQKLSMDAMLLSQLVLEIVTDLNPLKIRCSSVD